MALILDQQNPKPKKSMNSVFLKKEFFKVNLISSFKLECICHMNVKVIGHSLSKSAVLDEKVKN